MKPTNATSFFLFFFCFTLKPQEENNSFNCLKISWAWKPVQHRKALSDLSWPSHQIIVKLVWGNSNMSICHCFIGPADTNICIALEVLVRRHCILSSHSWNLQSKDKPKARIVDVGMSQLHSSLRSGYLARDNSRLILENDYMTSGERARKAWWWWVHHHLPV